MRTSGGQKRKENDPCRCPVADKLCELQKEIDEHERFLGDLLVMLCKRVPQCVIQHDVRDADWIWDKVRDLMQENKEMKAKLALAGIEFERIDEKWAENDIREESRGGN